MYIPYNANPAGHNTTDCTVRAIALATGTDWDTAYIALTIHGFYLKKMPDNDSVWWSFLDEHGFNSHRIMSLCPRCTTVREFCEEHPVGMYVLAVPGHVLTAVDGDWYDAWDSGDETVLHYWTKEDGL